MFIVRMKDHIEDTGVMFCNHSTRRQFRRSGCKCRRIGQHFGDRYKLRARQHHCSFGGRDSESRDAFIITDTHLRKLHMGYDYVITVVKFDERFVDIRIGRIPFVYGIFAEGPRPKIREKLQIKVLCR